jgi:hypothetical protein
MGSNELFFFLPGLAWNCDLPDLILLCSWDDRHESPHPAVAFAYANSEKSFGFGIKRLDNFPDPE